MEESRTDIKKKVSGLLTLFIIYLAIIADEGVGTILIESVATVAGHQPWILPIYMLGSMPFAIALAGWSDFHCRRKTIIFALFCTSASCALMALYNHQGHLWMAYLSLFLKGTGGNVIPIALATLADITNTKILRTRLAIAITAISIGFWVPIYFRTENSSYFFLTQSGVFITVAIVILALLFFRDNAFDGVSFQRNTANFHRFKSFLRREIKLVWLLILVPVVSVLLLGFIFSETSYYQFLMRGEFLQKNSYYSNNALILAVGYYIGTAVLIFGMRKITDVLCLKIGLWISLSSLISFLIIGWIDNLASMYAFLPIAVFSSGYAIITPSLFAALSKTRNSEDQGKIFGLLESTDTFSIFISSVIIRGTRTLSNYWALVITTILYSISVLLFSKFIRLYSRLTKRN